MNSIPIIFLISACVASCAGYVCMPPYRLDCSGLSVSRGGPLCVCTAPKYPTTQHVCPSGMTLRCHDYKPVLMSTRYAFYHPWGESVFRKACWCLRHFKPVPAGAATPAPTVTTIRPPVPPAPTTTPEPPKKQGHRFPTEVLLLNDTTFFSSNVGVVMSSTELAVVDLECSEGFGVYPLCLKTDRNYNPYGRASCPPIEMSCATALMISKHSSAKARGWFSSPVACINGSMRTNARGYQKNCNTVGGACQNSMDTGSDSTYPTTETLWTFCKSDQKPVRRRRVIAIISNGTFTPVNIRNPNTIVLLETFFGKSNTTADVSFADVMSLAELEHEIQGDAHPDIADFRSGLALDGILERSGVKPSTATDSAVELKDPHFLAPAVFDFYARLQQLEMPVVPKVKVNELFQLPSEGLLIQRKLKKSNVTFAPVVQGSYFSTLSLGYVNNNTCPYQLEKGPGHLCVTVPPHFGSRVVKIRQAYQKGQQGVAGCTASSFPPRLAPYGRGAMRRFAADSSDQFVFLGKQKELQVCTTKSSVQTLLPSRTTTSNNNMAEEYCDPTRKEWPVFGIPFNKSSQTAPDNTNLNSNAENSLPRATWSGGAAPTFNFQQSQWHRLKINLRSIYNIKMGGRCVYVAAPTDWLVSQSVCYSSAPVQPRCHSKSQISGPWLDLPCRRYAQGLYHHARLPVLATDFKSACSSLKSMTRQTVVDLAPGAVLVKGEMETCYNVSLLMSGVCVNNTVALTQLISLITQIYPPLTNYTRVVDVIDNTTAQLASFKSEFLKKSKEADDRSIKLLKQLEDIFSKAVNASAFEPTDSEEKDPPFQFPVSEGTQIYFLSAVILGAQLALVLLLSLPGLIAYQQLNHHHQD